MVLLEQSTGAFSPPFISQTQTASERLQSLNYLTILPQLGDISREASVHPVGEYVPMDDPQPSRCGLGQQL